MILWAISWAAATAGTSGNVHFQALPQTYSKTSLPRDQQLVFQTLQITFIYIRVWKSHSETVSALNHIFHCNGIHEFFITCHFKNVFIICYFDFYNRTYIYNILLIKGLYNILSIKDLIALVLGTCKNSIKHKILHLQLPLSTYHVSLFHIF